MLSHRNWYYHALQMIEEVDKKDNIAGRGGSRSSDLIATLHPPTEVLLKKRNAEEGDEKAVEIVIINIIGSSRKGPTRQHQLQTLQVASW